MFRHRFVSLLNTLRTPFLLSNTSVLATRSTPTDSFIQFLNPLLFKSGWGREFSAVGTHEKEEQGIAAELDTEQEQVVEREFQKEEDQSAELEEERNILLPDLEPLKVESKDESLLLPVLELNSEATKDLKEEDEVFDPSKLQTTKTDFIEFQNFVKWTQVRDAVDSLGNRVTVRHAVTAFSTLKGMLPRPPNAYLDTLSETLLDNIDQARSNHIARVFLACGKLRYINKDLFQALTKKIMKDKHLVEMDGCDLSGILYCLGILTRFQMFLFAAEKGMKTVDLYQMYTTETPAILFPLQPELIRTIAHELSSPNRLVGFREQELSQAVYGLGLLRSPETMALKSLAREINNSSRLPKFSAMELSNVVYGFGLVNFKDEGLLYGMCNHLLRTKRMSELETQHLANILYGFSKIHFNYPPFISSLIAEIVQPERLKRFREQELANIVSCSSLIGVQDKEFFTLLGKELIRPARLVKYMEHNLSTIVLGYASAGVRDIQMLRALVEEMRRPQRLPNYTSKDICDIIMGFNNLEFMDDSFMLALVAELRKPQRIKTSDTKVWQACRAHVFSWSLAFPF